MKRVDPLERELAELAELRKEPRAATAAATLQRILTGKRSLSVASAARLVGEAQLKEHTELLVTAFDRFTGKAQAGRSGADLDPGCQAKLAIAIALGQLEHAHAAFFLQAIRLVQRDPVFGGSVDAAVGVRQQAALILAPFGDARVVPALTRLLVDYEWPARLDAARALGATGRLEADAILRFKALSGDPEPQVMIEVLSALLSLSPHALPFVAGFLDGSHEQPAVDTNHTVVSGHEKVGAVCTSCGAATRIGDWRNAAALAIGQSRVDGALPVLLAHVERVGQADAESARIALLAVSMHRGAAALDYLLALVSDAPAATAISALHALALHRYDDALRDRVAAAVQARDPELGAAYHEAFIGER